MARKTSDSPSLFDLPLRPDFSLEAKLMARGMANIAGTDEAGRGPLAGPVVAAAVILDPDNIPAGLDDSKRMTKTAREAAFDEILKTSRAVAFCSQSAEEIDRTDIRKASLEAMRRAVFALFLKADHVLIDGRDVPPGLLISGTALVKGDQRSVSIAAASIVAKVLRDRMMEVAGGQFEEYGFDSHFGYGTQKHIGQIARIGPLPRLHRYSFAPIRKK
ncbi:MAG: ribonuclease HII [Rhizobiaceae bacterium]